MIHHYPNNAYSRVLHSYFSYPQTFTLPWFHRSTSWSFCFHGSQPAEQVPHTLGLRRLLLLLGREFGLQSHAIMPFTMKLSEKHRIQLFFAEGKTVKRLLHSVQLTIISLYRNWVYRNWVYRTKPQKTWSCDWSVNTRSWKIHAQKHLIAFHGNMFHFNSMSRISVYFASISYNFSNLIWNLLKCSSFPFKITTNREN